MNGFLRGGSGGRHGVALMIGLADHYHGYGRISNFGLQNPIRLTFLRHARLEICRHFP
jgi:hypothetical protein